MRSSPIARVGCPKELEVVGGTTRCGGRLTYIDGRLYRDGVARRTWGCACCGAVWKSEERIVPESASARLEMPSFRPFYELGTLISASQPRGS